jgi:branched-chain amino acid aminotransferase
VLGGELRTPETKMLRGIARGIVLEVAPAVLPINLEPIHVNDLVHIDEAMLSSASRRVMPVVKVGEVTVNGGKPGEVYRQILDRYDARVEAELETL